MAFFLYDPGHPSHWVNRSFTGREHLINYQCPLFNTQFIVGEKVSILFKLGAALGLGLLGVGRLGRN